MTEKEVSYNDTIRIVRVVIKCSDLLSDYDLLEGYVKIKKSKYIKHEIKETFFDLGAYIDKFSSAFLKPFVEEDDMTQMELQAMFNEFNKGIYIDNPQKTAFILLYSKVYSIMNDLSEMEIDNSQKTAFILLYSKVYSIMNDLSEMEYTDAMLEGLYDICKKFIDECYKKHFGLFNMEHNDENLVVTIITAIDNLGKKIMYGNKDEGRID